MPFFNKVSTSCYCIKITWLFAFCFLSNAKAQTTLTLPDSVLLQPLANARTGLGFALSWDARKSFINQQRVNIWGVNSGLVFGKKRSQVTIGYYWMSFNPNLRFLALKKGSTKLINLDYYTKTDLYFMNLMYWNNFIDTPHWRISMPFEVGIGSTRNLNNKLSTDLQVWKKKDYFIPTQVGLYARWKVTRWIGLSVQGGYRHTLLSKNIKNNYNGFYYSFGAEIQPALLRDVYRWIFKEKTPETLLEP
ncbi:hypothetical protein [Emticicia soli]|uniref:DUF2490 domain-containing protein n=1 Tax=Emticicia soli TaxID=2027878 RepID=A0ABW5J8I9_9BACT